MAPLALLLGACVSTQDGPLDLNFAEPISQAEQKHPSEPLARIQAISQIAPATPRPDPAEPDDHAAWRLRLTRL
jgi:hypothetical protein